ncbi:MAG TPA: FAD-binding oxidoreductase [Steroidobacteraceae bacterium]|nr:FAD-binding oxidoreductase [Steroidobacteraceae bacterium]
MTESLRVLAGDGLSLWQSLTKNAAAPSPLTGSVEVDIAIIGGGIAGLSLAFHLAAAGKRPIVLEAQRCGSGASGASAGIVAPQLVRTTPRLVQEKLGRERGTRLLSLIAEAGHYTFDLVRRHALDCAASQSGLLAPTRTASGLRRLSQTIEQWQPFRTDLQWLDAPAVRRLSGCEGYEGGLLDRSGGGLNPLAYARELARVATGQGASIHEESRAVDLAPAADGWRIRTEQGEVRAARVILCANGANGYLHPALRQTVLPMPVYEVATEPLDASLLATTLPENHVLTDIETDVFSLRWAPGGRLVTAYPAPEGVDRASIEAVVNRRLRSMLHRHETRRLDFVWHGVAWMNQSLLPRLVRVADDLTAVQACNGRGIALNTILGREVARWLLKPESYIPALSFESPRRVCGFGVVRYVPRLLMTAAMIAGRLTHRRRDSDRGP